jgi:hypothetical protein
MLRSVRVKALCFLLLLPVYGIKAQDKAGFETDIHSNVKLVTSAIPEDMPADFKAKYLVFLGQLKESIKGKTSERPATDALVFQVRPGIKEVGTAKTKRPMASVVAFKKSSKTEYRGDLILYSYTTGDNLSKDEIDKFLSKQILTPLETE